MSGNIIHLLAYGENYTYTASVTNLSTNETKEGIEGERSNEFVGNGEEWLLFRTRNSFKEPLPYHALQITAYTRTYDSLNPMNKGLSAGVDFANDPTITPAVVRANAPGSTFIDEAYMMLALLDLHFIGDQRKEIVTFDVKSREGNHVTWEIQTSDQSVELDVQDLTIEEIRITSDVYAFRYSLN